MKLNRDLTSKRWLHLKGWLFLFMGIFAATLLMVDSFSLRNLALLVIAIWSFCRFYYFLFYVLERYAGRERRYAGIADAMMYLLRGDRNSPKEN